MTPLQAELYALTHRGNAGDRELYARVAAGARRVLELGSGYGRLLEVLAGDDREVVGLERDPSLLALARRRMAAAGRDLARRVRLVAGDMRDFTLDERFDRVVVPHSGLYCLLDRASAVACLRAARRHLAPRGRVIFDVYAADALHAEGEPDGADDGALSPIVSFSHRGATWDVFERSRWQRRRQRLDVTYVYAPRGGGRVERIRIAQRYLLAPEFERLLARAGLELVRLRGGFGRGRRAPPKHWVVEARARRDRER